MYTRPGDDHLPRVLTVLRKRQLSVLSFDSAGFQPMEAILPSQMLAPNGSLKKRDRPVADGESESG